MSTGRQWPPKPRLRADHERAVALRAQILDLVAEFEQVVGDRAYWQDDNEGGTIAVEDLLDWSIQFCGYRLEACHCLPTTDETAPWRYLRTRNSVPGERRFADLFHLLCVANLDYEDDGRVQFGAIYYGDTPLITDEREAASLFWTLRPTPYRWVAGFGSI